MSVKITYFVHGTTTDNESSKSSGWNDAKLSDLIQGDTLESGIVGKCLGGHTAESVILKYGVDPADYAGLTQSSLIPRPNSFGYKLFFFFRCTKRYISFG